MRVQFDLRPASMLEKERKKSSFNFTRLLATLLFLGFLATNGFYLVTMAMQAVSLNSEIELKEGEVASLEGSKQALELEIRRLKEREKVFLDTLKIMQDDLPILEVLNELENHMPPGLTALNMQFTSSATGAAAVVKASAVTEEQIVELTNGLSSSGVFRGVVMPSSVKDEKTGRTDIVLNLTLRPIGELRGTTQLEARP